MDDLPLLTFIVNYCAFIIVLWLGLYLVMHNPRYPISWLTALTLWSLATLFLHYLLEPTLWLSAGLELDVNNWFEAIGVAPALAFWHHATMLMRPRQLNAWRWTRILAAYLFAAAAVVFQANTQIWSRTPGGDLLYLNSRVAGPLYPIFGTALLLFVIASTINLVRSARATSAALPRKQLLTLAWATIIAGLTIPALIAATIAGLPIPTTVVSLLLAITVGVIGYGVARYSAVMKGRTIHRDFFYNLILLGLVCLLYIPVCWTLVKVYLAPPIVVLLIPVLAVFTHSMVNLAYRLVDRMLLNRETRRMRADLQRLSRLAFDGDALSANLADALRALCQSVRATYGIVLAFEEDPLRTIAAYQLPDSPLTLSADIFKRDDVTHLALGQFPAPLEGAALLVPLYRENDQFGALLLGHPTNGLRYADEEVERILGPAEMIGEAIYGNSLRNELMLQISRLISISLPEERSPFSIGSVEDALRNLSDYTCLADSPLAGMGLTRSRLPHGPVTHLERGKAVHDLLLEILEKLNPGREIPRDPPPREWYPYLILKEAYIDGVSNRDIMMHLYISEGTFNRTRRLAIRSVARALQEMEENLG